MVDRATDEDLDGVRWDPGWTADFATPTTNPVVEREPQESPNTSAAPGSLSCAGKGPAGQSAVLTITVKKAQGIRAADRGGTSDPYVKLYYEDPHSRGKEDLSAIDASELKRTMQGINKSVKNAVSDTRDAISTVTSSLGSAARASIATLTSRSGSKSGTDAIRTSGKLSHTKSSGRILFGETKFIPKTLSPEWNESFRLELTHPYEVSPAAVFNSLYCIMELWDRDAFPSPHELLGVCRVYPPRDGSPFESWLPLVKPDNAAGEVLVRVEWESPPPNLVGPTPSPDGMTEPPNSIDMLEECIMRSVLPPLLYPFCDLYRTVAVGPPGKQVVLDVPPTSEVILDSIESVIFGKDAGTLYLTDFRLVFVPFSVSEHRSSSLAKKQAEQHASRLLSVPIGTVVSSNVTVAGSIVVAQFSRKVGPTVVLKMRGSERQAANAARMLQSIANEITWRCAEGNFAFSLCDHELDLIRKLNGESPRSLAEWALSSPRAAKFGSSAERGVTVCPQPLSPAYPHSLRRRISTSQSQDFGKLKPNWRTMEEFRRLGVASGKNLRWRTSQSNHLHALCGSYSATLVIPATFPEEKLAKAAAERSKGRLPALTWLHPDTGAPLCRCAQPHSGMMQKQLPEDNELLHAIRCAATVPEPVLQIYDARPKLNANANAVKGKGFESIANLGGSDVANLTFCDIGNIHVMRQSLHSLMKACNDPGNGEFWSLIVSSRWLDHLSLILSSAQAISKMLCKGQPCVVHCSDGWDRTSQLAATASLLLDPHYRTITGFVALVEKDWVSFGHKFEDRIGAYGKRFMEGETSPVFVQWLDCVYQLLYQHPTEFEFSEDLLLFIADTGCHSGWFGTFLCNNEFERIDGHILSDTVSVWDYIISNQSDFINPLFCPTTAPAGVFAVPLDIDTSVSSLVLWRSLYQQYSVHSRSMCAQLRKYAHKIAQGRPQIVSAAESDPSTLKERVSSNESLSTPLSSTVKVPDKLEFTSPAPTRQDKALEPLQQSQGSKRTSDSGAEDRRRVPTIPQTPSGSLSMPMQLSKGPQGSVQYTLTVPTALVLDVASGKRVAMYSLKVRQTVPRLAEWMVRRRYSDFAWLQDKLGHSIVQKLPKKTLWKSYKKSFLENRRQILDAWVQQLPHLRVGDDIIRFTDHSVEPGLDDRNSLQRMSRVLGT